MNTDFAANISLQHESVADRVRLGHIISSKPAMTFKYLLLPALVLALMGCAKKDEAPSTSTTTTNPTLNSVALQPLESPAQKLLHDISGVWSDGSGLVYFYPHDNKFQLLIGDEPKIASVGDIDIAQGTVNIILIRTDNNQKAIWTVKKIVNPSASAYTLHLTMHDGTATDLSFVRSIGSDDISHLLEIYSQNNLEGGSVAQSAQTIAAPNTPTAPTAPTAPTLPVMPAPTPAVASTAQAASAAGNCESTKLALYNSRYDVWKTQQAIPPTPDSESTAKQLAALAVTKSCAREKEALITGKPSFNCDKASTYVEHQICASAELAQLDTRLSSANASAKFFAYDQVAFAQSGAAWRAKRDACTDVICISAVYNQRITDLSK
jgi:hypothetical protein